MTGKWKLLSQLKNDTALVADELGFNPAAGRGYRPIVVFYDADLDCYYYIRIRMAKELVAAGKGAGTFEYKRQFPGEILIRGQRNGSPDYDSYVDCSTVLRIDAPSLEAKADVRELRGTGGTLSRHFVSFVSGAIKANLMKNPIALALRDAEAQSLGGGAAGIADGAFGDLAFNPTEWIRFKDEYAPEPDAADAAGSGRYELIRFGEKYFSACMTQRELRAFFAFHRVDMLKYGQWKARAARR